ncbi:MAG: phosphoribosylaminoimidazole-succinocarboxamide synthase [Arenicella sp.]|jgi:phosphoribosylaminoimidazole-succinocarboxamide synthase
MKAVKNTTFNFPGQQAVYNGKVRDVYTLDNDFLVIVASDRISAFDYILHEAIPYKGQVLNQLAAIFLKATSDIVPNWLIETPDPMVAVGHKCEPYKIEMVIRGYMSGHAAREYKLGKRILCGADMPDGMIENDKFPSPIITPATKAEEGHDEDISREEIIAQGIVSEDEYKQLEAYTYALFERGTQMAAEKGLILVDTKYEFGKKDGKIYLIDEIHTPDSSRYFYADGYAERQSKGEKQKQLSKEFVREWLIENNFQGLDGQILPNLPEEFVNSVTERYIELYEKISGETFVMADNTNIEQRIEENVVNCITNV